MVNAIAAARVTEPRAIRVTTPSILGVGRKRAALRRVPDESSFSSSPLSAEVPPRQRARLWRTASGAADRPKIRKLRLRLGRGSSLHSRHQHLLPFLPEVPPALECSANCAELS